MKLTFLGTRGEIEARTRRHHLHTSLEVSYLRRRIMIDAGEDWLGRVEAVRPHAIVITHAHPDHAWGLKAGAPCPVWATDASWSEMKGYPLAEEQRRLVRPRESFVLEGMTLEAFPVEHSIRAPAVGYRITAGKVTVFYGPDLVYINDRSEALSGCRIYIGDGATMTESFVRRRGDRLIGHAPVRTQLTWCQKEGVPRAIITHCGKEIVEGAEPSLTADLRAMAESRGIRAELAHDGLEVILR